MRRTLLVLAAWALAAAGPARAQNWFDAIFPEPSKDYGTVARGSKIRHTFRLINTTNHEIHIAQYRTKCGCTEVKVGAYDIPPGAQTVIEATLDTTKFKDYKASGLTVVFDRPQFAEKDLNLTCFIRGDVLLTPGLVDFGAVARGARPTATLKLTYLGGMTNWGVTKVQTISPHVSARLETTSRTPGGPVEYQLTATLSPTAPAGHFRDEITLLTNDSASPSIPISVAATVQAAVVASPPILTLGPVRAGQVVTKSLLVRAAKPFKITAATAKRPELTATVGDDASQPLHKLTVTFKAPQAPGPFGTTLEIATDLEDEPQARVSAFATVVP